MVSVRFDENTKHRKCETCCHETTVCKTSVEEWDERTDDWMMIWLCIGCVNFIKHCSFCAKPTINWWGRYNQETVKILRKTGKTVCEDCCEHVMAATTAVYAAGVDTRPGHYHSSTMSDAEYEKTWHELIYEWAENEWMIHEYQARDTLFDEFEDMFCDNQEDECVGAEEAFYETYDRQQAKKSAKGKKPVRTDSKSTTSRAKKGNKKLNKVGKPCSTADHVAFNAIWNYAEKSISQSEVIPEIPRAALQRMDVPDKAFSDIDMEMEIRTVCALDRPITMTVNVPVPACLLKRREPLKAAEFGKLMVAVWKAYKGDLVRFLDWPDTHIRNFRKSNIIVDFTAVPIEF
jgi:hypothetical protein